MTTPDRTAQSPLQSPIFHALHAGRYDRQALIASYEEQYNCRLVVLIDALFGESVPLFEELIYDASPDEDLHVLLHSPGGDGETAVRLIRSMQSRSKEVTVIVPDQAKSAATLLALGAHDILMGPTSDLGPIDPQFPMGAGQSQRLVAAKDIIAAVDEATRAVQEAPNIYPIYASLLGDVTAIQVQQARSALGRTENQLVEALKSNPDRNDNEVSELKEALKESLIQGTKSHAAFFGIDDAKAVGLPVLDANHNGNQWQTLWRLYTKYVALGPGLRAYEGHRASYVSSWGAMMQDSDI